MTQGELGLGSDGRWGRMGVGDQQNNWRLGDWPVCNCAEEYAAPCPATITPPTTPCKLWSYGFLHQHLGVWCPRKSGFLPLKLSVWKGFICSDFALGVGRRLRWKLFYGESTDISRATSHVPWAQMASGQREPTSCDRHGLEFEAITLEPEEAQGLQETFLEALVSIVVSHSVGP